jgi:hypothetical protein
MAPPDGPRWSEQMEINVAADVDILLDRLGKPPADDAYLADLRHDDPDSSPVVKVAVRQDWVYLRWLDDDFDGAPVGDDSSPVAHGGYEPEYLAGTGLPTAVAAKALKQWLVTGHTAGCGDLDRPGRFARLTVGVGWRAPKRTRVVARHDRSSGVDLRLTTGWSLVRVVCHKDRQLAGASP